MSILCKLTEKQHPSTPSPQPQQSRLQISLEGNANIFLADLAGNVSHAFLEHSAK